MTEIQTGRPGGGEDVAKLRRTLSATRRELRTMRERLRLAHEAGRAGTFEWNIPVDKVMWSPELEALYGVPEGTFEGRIRDWSKRVNPEDSARILEEIQGVLARQEADYAYEFRVRRPDGEERWLSGRARFFYAEDGSASRMVGINVDIHERRVREEALIRTEKLAAVGRLAASIAHEINNPLESVTNLLYLAREGYGREDVATYLKLAEQELQRVSAITHQTLRFYRQSSAPKECTAEELFDASVSIYKERLERAKVMVERGEGSGAAVPCFEGEIRQVLSNLVGNAIDAMEKTGGGLKLRSRVGRDWQTGREGLWLMVADSGSGIAEEDARRIFEPFFTTKGSEGTGLGLWVSQEIVKRHHGVLLVRSRVNVGTVFLLFLPFAAGR